MSCLGYVLPDLGRPRRRAPGPPGGAGRHPPAGPRRGERAILQSHSFKRFDSSRILSFRGGIPRPKGNPPEGLSQRILCWRFLAREIRPSKTTPHKTQRLTNHKGPPGSVEDLASPCRAESLFGRAARRPLASSRPSSRQRTPLGVLARSLGIPGGRGGNSRALAHGARDCRLEPCRGHVWLPEFKQAATKICTVRSA